MEKRKPRTRSFRKVNWNDPDWDKIYYCHHCGAWAPTTHSHT